MLFKKERLFKDEELGILKARSSIFEPSIFKWKKRIDFLGFDLDVEVSGTSDKLNDDQRKIILNALDQKELIEIQAMEAIQVLCLRNNIKFAVWADYFQCSHIYVKDFDLYISIKDMMNNLAYELEFKRF